MAVSDQDKHKTLVLACSDGAPVDVEVAKIVLEYPLPASKQTHEMAKIGDDLLLVSQQTNSHVVKVKLDPSTGRPLEAKSFRVGESIYAGLHGLCASWQYEKNVWATLQFESAVLLLDPLVGGFEDPPKVLYRINLPPSVWGPHVVVESADGDLWITCKVSHHVVRVRKPLDMKPEISTFKCSAHPIFVAVHSQSGDVYASLDESSKILRITGGATSAEIDIPPDKGNTPVGMLTGPDGNVWFALLGDQSGGTGTFGRISKEGDITWYNLSSATGAQAGLIHLAFGEHKGGMRLWLLGSSLTSNKCMDAIFTVEMDDADPPHIVRQSTITLATRNGMSHRILLADGGEWLFVTQLAACVLVHVRGQAALGTLEKCECETTDAYGIWGMGCRHHNVKYVDDNPHVYYSQPPQQEVSSRSQKRPRT